MVLPRLAATDRSAVSVVLGVVCIYVVCVCVFMLCVFVVRGCG